MKNNKLPIENTQTDTHFQFHFFNVVYYDFPLHPDHENGNIHHTVRNWARTLDSWLRSSAFKINILF